MLFVSRHSTTGDDLDLFTNFTVEHRFKDSVQISDQDHIFAYQFAIEDLNSTVAKRGSVFIGFMTSDGAIWSRYQRTVLMR